MPPLAGQQPVKVPQVVIDLTLGDDEESSSTEQRLSNNLKHVASLLQQVPPVHHGLPIFEPSADHKSKRRDGASGRNYFENPIQQSFEPLNAAPKATQTILEPRVSGPSNNRKSLIRPFASLEDPSNRGALGSGSPNLANTVKRRKTNTNHDGVSPGGRGSSETSRGNVPSRSTISQRTSQPIDLTTVTTRTVITGESRLQSSYSLSRSSGEGIDQEDVPIDNQKNDSNVLLQKVLKHIRLALRSHKNLSTEDRNEVAWKVAELLIVPKLKANFENNNGKLSKQYEENIARQAKAHVDALVKTFKRTRASRSFNSVSEDDGFKESEKSSSYSPAAEEIFERLPVLQHPGSNAALSRSYSESPTTELSNDPIDCIGSLDLETSRKTHAKHSAPDTAHSLRRSGRAATKGSQPLYVLGRKRRRRNPQPGHADESPAGEEVGAMPIDLGYEAENEAVEPTSEFDMQHVDTHNVAQPTTTAKKPEAIPSDKVILSLIKEREMYGMDSARLAPGRKFFKATTYASLEDSFTQQSEWTDCSGDISSISWITEETFLCGALAHLDPRNMQYNKPGNLLLGSTTHETLRSFADHRLVRPLVDETQSRENASESMRRTQDPWTYQSVASTAHCVKNGFSFTASFDETVKIWSVVDDGSSMDLAGSWMHEGKVNFVVTSNHHERVATASEVDSNAVRVYNFDKDSVSESAYTSYCGSKAQEQNGEIRRQDKWSYHPATIQWGKAPQVANLILVGYSPRSVSNEDDDIPDDKKNTGELCVWNVENREAITISSGRTQNVFEVQWHPTQPVFVAATSPCGMFDTEKTKTQIRLFALNKSGAFLNIKALDCPALDINELTIMPNCQVHCYVTASCTDGNTYVYDTAQGDLAIHILPHGDSLETLSHDLPREVDDEGVKFAAWGQTTNRFYTGSSDGKVKAWNIKAPAGKAFVRDVLTLAGGITTGAFSKDFSKFIIGDATGKVYLMSANDRDLEGDPIALKDGKTTAGMRNSAKSISSTNTSGISNLAIRTLPQMPQQNALLPRNIKRPKLIIPHAEPPPPAGYEVIQEKKQTSAEIAQHLLNEGLLEQHVGAGVYQGPNYAETKLYWKEAHENRDPSQPLLPEYLAQQQFMMRQEKSELKLDRLPRAKSSDPKKHEENQKLEFDFSQLSVETQNTLKEERAEVDEEEWFKDFKYDILPNRKIFRNPRKKAAREARSETTENGEEMKG